MQTSTSRGTSSPAMLGGIDFANESLRYLMRAGGALGSFAAASCATLEGAVGGLSSSDVWPIPVCRHWVRPSTPGSSQPTSSRRRARLAVWRAARKMRWAVVVALNFLRLGRPGGVPKRLCAGRGLSAAQWATLARIEALTIRFARLSVEGCGRKVAPLYAAVTRMINYVPPPEEKGRADVAYAGVPRWWWPAASDMSSTDEDSEGDPFDLEAELARLARRVRPPPAAPDTPAAAERGVPHRPGREPHSSAPDVVTSGTDVPVVASRLVFAAEPPAFEAADYLPGFERAALIEPRLLEYEGVPTGKPHPPPARQGGVRHEVLAVLHAWERSGRLLLVPSRMCPASTRMKLQAVAKDEAVDRLICNRQRRNQVEHRLLGCSAELPGAAALTEVVLHDGEVMDTFVSDLRDMYHTFRVSEDRALTNGVALPLTAAEARGFPRAWRRMVTRFGEDGPFVACFQTLPMGDGIAVDVACRAHAAVLEEAGLANPWCRVRGALPLPRSAVLDLLVVDDWVSVITHKVHDREPVRQGELRMDAAVLAYRRVGLEPHERKQIRGARVCTVLGAQLDGGAGFVSASPEKVLRIAAVSRRLSRCRWMRGDLVRKTLSHWVFVLGFAKHGMSIFHAAFRWLGSTEQDAEIRRLPRQVAQEFLLAAILAPLFISDIRAKVLPQLVAGDASEFALGAVRAEMPQTMAEEAWRSRDRRGHRTRLDPALAARGRAGGLGELEREEGDADVEPSALPRVERVLIETFDIVEVFCGPRAPLLTAASALGLRTGPRIDITVHPSWDFRQDRVVQWLFHLLENDLVFYLHMGPPCTTFSVARQPHARTAELPWGRVPREAAVVEGNYLVQVCLALARRCAAVPAEVHCTIEHPRSAFTWKLPSMMRLVKELEEGCHGGFIDYDVCAFGEARDGTLYKKPSRLLRVRAEWLRPLGQRCPGFHRHDPLQGSAGKRAAEYTLGVVSAWAALLAEGRRQDDRQLGEASLRTLDEVGSKRGETLWVNELAGGLEFQPFFSTPVPDTKHINVRELETQVNILRRLAAEGHGSCRALSLLDSQVAQGVIGKGRSGSRALNRVWSRALPYTIGTGVQLGALYCPTRRNPADAPSRLRPVGPPLHAAPTFVTGQCDQEEWAKWALLPRQPREVAEWARVVVKLCLSRGRALRISSRGFDATRGYPGEGPRPQALPLAHRPRIQLEDVPSRDPAVRLRRAQWFTEFVDWWDVAFEEADPLTLSKGLARYGQALYDAGRPLGVYLEVVNACVDQRPELRGRLQAAWRVGWAWRGLVPARNHRPMPGPALKAAVAVALLENAVDLAAILAIGFSACLRPAELLTLKVNDVLLPSKTLGRAGSFYVTVGQPKMRRLAARREHVLVEQPSLTSFLEQVLADREGEELLFRNGPRGLTTAFDEVVRVLGLPRGDLTGLTLASLRAGGATWLFESTRDLELVRWRGRWSSMRTLEIYIQEVSADRLLVEVSPDVRARVRGLAGMSSELMRRWRRIEGDAEGVLEGGEEHASVDLAVAPA